MIITHDINDISPLLYGKKVFVFDFDGTIADTEPLHWQAYNICLSEFNITLSDDYIRRYIGNTEINIYKMIKEDFKIEFDEADFFEKRISIYLELCKTQNLQPYEFFADLYRKYRDTRFSILSSQKTFVINKLLKQWELQSVFDKILSVAAGDISKAEVLQNVDNFYGCLNSEIVLFEDANKYLALAKNEKIVAIGVQNQYNHLTLKDCDAIVRVK